MTTTIQNIFAGTAALPLLFALATPAGAEDSSLTLSSRGVAPTLIELYTSEGCSSCPPADQWLSGFTEHSELFTKVIPLAFHVDYWDGLGWEDRFAKPEFSQRQRNLARARNLSQVYTPGFVVNAAEWRQWFSDRSAEPPMPGNSRGTGLQLSATVHDEGKLNLDIQMSDIRAEGDSEPDRIAALLGKGELTVNMAVFGMGLSTEVRSGENRSRTLQHDFVVLSFASLSPKSARFETSLPLSTAGQSETGLAVWISEKDGSIMQAVAGLLPSELLLGGHLENALSVGAIESKIENLGSTIVRHTAALYELEK